MPIELNVQAKFEEASARRVARTAQDALKQEEAELRVKAKLEEASAKKAVSEADRLLRSEKAAELRVEAALKADAAREVMAKFNAELKAQRKAVIEVETKVDSDSVTRAASDSARVFSRSFISQLGTALPVGIGGEVGAAIAAGIAVPLFDIAKGAVTASQSIALLPAAAGAAASALGTLKLATLGFDDAMKNIGDPEKFATSLQSLAPNAQQAALEIRNLLPAFKDLQSATQNALFAGMGEQIHRLTNEYLPEVRQMTTGIADAFNQMLRGVADQLMTPETQGALQQFMSNTVTAFQQLAPAVAPFTKAMADIMAVGSEFLPGLARSVADAAQAFADFISNAKESGQLHEFIQNGIDAVKVFGQFLWDLGGIIYQVFGSDGKKNVETLHDTLQSVTDVVSALTGDFSGLGARVTSVFHDMTPAGEAFRDFWMDIPEALAASFNWLIDRLNDVKHAIENFVRNAQNVLAFLNPFGGAGPAFQPLPDIPHVPSGGDWNTFLPPQGQPNLGGLPGAQRDRRGAAPLPSSNPFAGPSPFSSPNAGLPAYAPSAMPTPTPPAAAAPTATEAAAAAAAASHVEDTHGVLVPNALQLQELIKRVFPAVTSIGGYRPPDGYNEHSSGEALDIMVGANRALGDQVNQFLLANADALGLQYDIWQQATWKPGGGYSPMADRGSPTENHMDHVHARVLPGAAKPFGRGIGTPSTAGSLGSSGRVSTGDAIPVFVTNMPSGGFGGGGTGGASGGLGAFSGPGGTAGPTDLLGAFFKGLSSGGGWGGVAGGIGTNILGMASSATGPGASTFAGLGASASASAMGPAAFAPPINPSGTNWDAIAQKESGGNWGINTGNGYYGGLQFLPETWASYGGTGMPQDASREEQIRIAENVLKGQGPSAWPNTYSAGAPAPGFAGGGGVDNIPAMLTEGEHVLTREDVAALGGQGGVYALRRMLHRQGGGPIPTADPRGFDPHGGKDAKGGLGPFAPWWDMDWEPPKHPERISPSIPGVEGKWWHHGPTPTPGPGQRFPPLGKNRKPLPSDQAPPDSRIKLWGFATGGAVGFQAGGAAGYQLGDPKNPPPKPPPAPPPPIVVNTGQGTGPPPGPSGPSVGAAIGATIQGRAQGEGGWQPGKSAGGGGGGGLLGQAAGMFPGGQVAAQLATRAAEFGGQLLAIGASGLMETFLPSGSTLGDPSKSWFGKLASGFGGARSSIPNTAGKIEPVAQQPPPGSPASGQGGGPPPGPAIGVNIENMHNNNGQDGQAVARDINRQMNAHGAGSGW